MKRATCLVGIILLFGTLVSCGAGPTQAPGGGGTAATPAPGSPTNPPAPANPTNPSAPTNAPAQPSGLVGAWQQAPDQADYTWGLLFTRIEFLGDGTFILNVMNAAGQYSFPDPTHLKLASPGSALMYGFSLSGDTLTLTDADGKDWRFQRAAATPIPPSNPPVQAADLVGAWEQVPEQANYEWALLFTRIEFLADGSFVLNIMNTAGQYSLPDANHLKLENPGSMLVYGFSLSGNTLTLIDADGGAWRFQKVQ